MQVCNNWLQKRIDDHGIQSDYNCTSGLQNPERKNTTLGIASVWWNWATRRTTAMTKWPSRPRAPSTSRTWNSTRELMHAWSHVRIVVRFWSSWFAHHIVAQVVRLSYHPCMQGAFLFDFELSIPSNFLFLFIFNLLQFLLHFSHNLEGSSNTAYMAKKGDGLNWRILPPHRLWAQKLRPHGDLCRVLHRFPGPATVFRATVSRNPLCTLAKEMGSTDESFSNTGYEPKDYFLTVTYVEFNQESMTSNGSPRTWITMMPQSVRCSLTHTEYKFITPSEKACLSVSRRRPWPAERSNPL